MKNDRSMHFFAFGLALPVAALAAVLFFIPLYRTGVHLSAYELLEQRFGYWARCYAAVSYVALQLLRVAMVNLLVALQTIVEKMRGGGKIEERAYKGAQVDLYFATPETWACLLLIRTGSKQHNIKLTSLAKARGWHLYANGVGLVNEKGERVAGDTEESFFAELGLRYLEPWEREP